MPATRGRRLVLPVTLVAGLLFALTAFGPRPSAAGGAARLADTLAGDRAVAVAPDRMTAASRRTASVSAADRPASAGRDTVAASEDAATAPSPVPPLDDRAAAGAAADPDRSASSAGATPARVRSSTAPPAALRATASAATSSAATAARSSAAPAPASPAPSVPAVSPAPAVPPRVPAVAPQMRLRFPAIGLSAVVHDFGCRGGTLPNLVERWDCAGKNNTYLLGHAATVFRPLHDAYAARRLRVGQVAYFTIDGKTRAYRVAWIRVVPSTYHWHGLPGQAWAWSATSRPSLTLQTCWGAASQYRIIVRLTS